MHEDTAGTDGNDLLRADTPTSIAGVFRDLPSADGALHELRRRGFAKAWLAMSEPAADGSQFPVVVQEMGGGKPEEIARLFSGHGDRTLHAALLEHGVADDVARHLDTNLAPGSILVVAGSGGDIEEAARCITEHHGEIIRGSDTGEIGTPKPIAGANLNFVE